MAREAETETETSGPGGPNPSDKKKEEDQALDEAQQAEAQKLELQGLDDKEAEESVDAEAEKDDNNKENPPQPDKPKPEDKMKQKGGQSYQDAMMEMANKLGKGASDKATDVAGAGLKWAGEKVDNLKQKIMSPPDSSQQPQKQLDEKSQGSLNGASSKPGEGVGQKEEEQQQDDLKNTGPS